MTIKRYFSIVRGIENANLWQFIFKFKLKTLYSYTTYRIRIRWKQKYALAITGFFKYTECFVYHGSVNKKNAQLYHDETDIRLKRIWINKV